MAKHSIQITDSKLYDNIVEYCKINGLKVSFLCTDMLRKQFLVEKYGDVPFGSFQDSSVTYDDKIVTSAVINTNNPNIGVAFEETINKDNGETKVKAIKMHKSSSTDTQVVTVPWVPVGCLTDEEKKKLSLETENNNVIVSPPLTKEIVEKYKKPVSEKFYGEIATDALIEKSEIEVKQTTKPKKRRL
jgi:hypothetical protein